MYWEIAYLLGVDIFLTMDSGLELQWEVGFERN
jgi:hypothetical protein